MVSNTCSTLQGIHVPGQGRYQYDLALCWQPSRDCDFSPEQLEVVQRTSKMLWTASSADPNGGPRATLRSYLLHECTNGFVNELREWFHSQFQTKHLKALVSSIVKPDSHVLDKIRRSLVESVGRTKLYRLKKAFSIVLQGKTKVWARLHDRARKYGQYHQLNDSASSPDGVFDLYNPSLQVELM